VKPLGVAVTSSGVRSMLDTVVEPVTVDVAAALPQAASVTMSGMAIIDIYFAYFMSASLFLMFRSSYKKDVQNLFRSV
jgi:dolichyl-phosphate-mannose--protein O-mannosyl transferase